MPKALSYILKKISSSNSQDAAENNSSAYSILDRIILFDNHGNEEIVNHIEGLNLITNSFNPEIRIHKSAKFANCTLEIGNKNVHICLGNVSLNNLYVRCSYGDSQHLQIGDNTTINGAAFFLDETGSIIIGEDNMFSNDIRVWASDGHAIIDMQTGVPLNPVVSPLTIGNHCWIGEGVRILKNTSLPDNCVVGGGSVLSKKYEESNVVLAGNPAKVIKRGINWRRENPFWLEQRGKC